MKIWHSETRIQRLQNEKSMSRQEVLLMHLSICHTDMSLAKM